MVSMATRRLASCFWRSTGRTRQGVCSLCNAHLEESESCDSLDPDITAWELASHKAPCGAHCAGAGTPHGEQDVHGSWNGPCPRCGCRNPKYEEDVVATYENRSHSERVVIHCFRVSKAHRIKLEKRRGDFWELEGTWNGYASFAATLDLAKRYFRWLGQEMQ